MQPSPVDTHSQIAPAEIGRIPATLLEAMHFYGDPDVATRTLAAARWGDAIECLHCHSRGRHFYISTRRIWKCRSCRKQFSPKAGTIFEDSPIGLDRWLIAIWVMGNSDQRISTYKLHRLLGVTQTTAAFMLRRIRLAMQARSSASERSAASAAAHAR
jgi:transposase-like protein